MLVAADKAGCLISRYHPVPTVSGSEPQQCEFQEDPNRESFVALWLGGGTSAVEAGWALLGLSTIFRPGKLGPTSNSTSLKTQDGTLIFRQAWLCCLRGCWAVRTPTNMRTAVQRRRDSKGEAVGIFAICEYDEEPR